MAKVDQSRAMTVTTESGTVYRFGLADEAGWRELDRNGVQYRARIEGLGHTAWLSNVVDRPGAALEVGEMMVVRLDPDNEFENIRSTPIREIRQD